MSEASEEDCQLFVMYFYNFELTVKAGDWLVIIFEVVKIGYTLVVCTAYFHGMAKASVVITNYKYIDVDLKLILIQMDIIE